MTALDFLQTRLDELRERGLFRVDDGGQAREQARSSAQRLGVPFIDASSNDYLNYTEHPPDVSRETPFRGSDRQRAFGAGASRLIHGTRAEHTTLESELAEWMSLEAALLFSSGYAANVGVISALAQPGDIVISDALNHASIIDGCRLSRADIRITPHLDCRAIEATLDEHQGKGTVWVITETYFSMDGDSPDLVRIRALCTKHQAVMIVDEAHALGVFGPGGAGLCTGLHVKPDVVIGTFGKALGAQGAFVATSRLGRDWLWNRARSFVYSTATSPLLTSCVSNNLRQLRADDVRRERLASNVSWLRSELGRRGVPVLQRSHGPILPIVLGDPQRALRAAACLGESGVLAQAIRPPTVPEGSARIRLTIHAGLDAQQLQRLACAVIDVCKQS
jgi:8-amino-7-oxononanoate synthase